MDLQIPHSALVRYLNTNAKPEEIANSLSLCGPTVDYLESINNDYIYHVEIITNRVDAASAYGLAREAAAILPEFGFEATLIPIDTSIIESLIQKSNLPPLNLSIQNNPLLNFRLTAIQLCGVNIKPSPDWLISVLTKYGQRPLNNLIDITNYVMFELGHPVHVFDLDRLTTKKIIVREARPKEVFTTLDGVHHTALGGEIIYDDGTGKIIDLPGIMGTQNSVVTPHTRNALIWIEDSDSQKIRWASLKHQLRTHAAVLNEKNVDPELTLQSLLNTASLALELTGGQLASQIFDQYEKPWHPRTIDLDHSWLEAFAGIPLDPQKVKAILHRLHFNPDIQKNQNYHCHIPSFRDADINLKEDLAEEVLRINGYFRLPSSLPHSQLNSVPVITPLSWEYQVKNYLANLGLTEIYNHSLISQDLVNRYQLDTDSLFKLENPLSEDYLYMRSCLLPSLLENYNHNQAFIKSPIMIFELSNIYLKSANSPLAQEIPHLAYIASHSSFGQIKGFLEVVALKLKCSLSYQKNMSSALPSYFSKNQVASVWLNQTQVGFLGQLDNSLLFGAEINFSTLTESATTIHTFTPLSVYSPIIEDLTFTLPKKTPLGPILAYIPTINPIISKVELKTIYHQNYTFTLNYQSYVSQLSDKDIMSLRKHLVSQLSKTYQAILVGNLD